MVRMSPIVTVRRTGVFYCFKCVSSDHMLVRFHFLLYMQINREVLLILAIRDKATVNLLVFVCEGD